MNIESLTLSEYRTLTAQLTSLTDAEIKLNNYIQLHFNALPYHGIIDLASNAVVSKATIGRYLNKLGFIGYSSFKRAVERAANQQRLISPIEVINSVSNNSTTDTKVITREFTHNISKLIENIHEALDIDSLNKLITLILNEDKHIYVVGPSSSYAMAKHFSTLLKYFRNDIACLSIDIGELPKQLVGISSQDVLIVFSYYRFNKVVVDIAKWCKQKEVSVVVVTNTYINPYARFADLQFVLPSEANTVFQSRMIGFYFVELILHLTYEKSETEGNFERLEELFDFFGTFSATT